MQHVCLRYQVTHKPATRSDSLCSMIRARASVANLPSTKPPRFVLGPPFAPHARRTVEHIARIIPRLDPLQKRQMLAIEVSEIVRVLPVAFVHVRPSVRRQRLHRRDLDLRDILVDCLLDGGVCAWRPAARNDIVDVRAAPRGVDTGVGIFEGGDGAAANEDDVDGGVLLRRAGEGLESRAQCGEVVGQGGAVEEAGA